MPCCLQNQAIHTLLETTRSVLLRLKIPSYIKSRPSHSSDAYERHHQKCGSFPVFRNHRKSKEMKRVGVAETGREKLVSPLPLAPSSSAKSVLSGIKIDAVVEEACRSFEKYLLEMIVEEGNVRDLVYVEELLYCWKNLKSPVFAELVARFYGELCKDLFSPEES